MTMVRTALFAGACLWAAAAGAATFTFTVTSVAGSTNPFPTFTFQLPDSPVPDFDLGYGFEIDGVHTDGTSQFGPVSYDADYSFYAGTGLDAGFDDGSAYHSYFSRQLFTGTTAAPTFTLGSYALYDDPAQAKVATLVISGPSGAVPEPATWAMMVAGFGGIGAALRRRRRTGVRFG